MRAVVCTDGRLTVEDVPTPVPGHGELLLKVVRTGICGSDLHARHHCDATADAVAEAGYEGFMRSHERVVMGHELAGEVVSYGPGCREEWEPGTLVTALPMLRHDGALELVGYSERVPGGYAEYCLVAEDFTLPVPPPLDAEQGALAEPLAVAVHAVRRGQVGRRDTAVVVGCGPVGLCVVLALKARGVRRVVAADPSPERRATARRLGADIVVDPATEDLWTAYPQPATEARTLTERYSRGFDAMASLRRHPRLPWWRVVRGAERARVGIRGPVVFECVGAPGVMESILSRVPVLSRIVVVGVCMGEDAYRPVMGTNKELELRYVFTYDPSEFRDAVQLMASGSVDARPLVTRTVGLADIPAVFDELSRAPGDVKVMVDPWR